MILILFLGLLGRLAYEAGFDFVSYESRSYIHCSVKTKYPDYRALGGCFSGNSKVYTPEGEKLMTQLHVGDKVLVVTPNGDLDFSEVILFLDRDNENSRWYRTIVTENNIQITLTSKHLIYTASEEKTSYNNRFATFAKNIRIGNYIYVLKTARKNEISLERVVNITVSKEKGVFAPLTKQGTIVVNNVVASCYAVVSDHELAHFAFSPMRIIHNFKEALWHFFHSVNLKIPPARHQKRDGIHWYAEFLYKIINPTFHEYLFFS
ncbi:protein hedgehog [Trichonephila inaurata madagascariensis]|uniref:Protein hedgehog n=1 Tax=Trichonephila inaurata madagascariensis TaxID=2747483 RepID=A0A8X6Y0U4_9ARAC|nr:protein hedgehog [Trichonephila inaurata madagascariensis]